MKRKNPTIQGSYGEIFQPDVMPQWQLWGGCIVLIAALIPLIIWSIQGDDPILPGVTALLAVIFVLFEGQNVMVNRRNRALAFGGHAVAADDPVERPARAGNLLGRRH